MICLFQLLRCDHEVAQLSIGSRIDDNSDPTNLHLFGLAGLENCGRDELKVIFLNNRAVNIRALGNAGETIFVLPEIVSSRVLTFDLANIYDLKFSSGSSSEITVRSSKE